MEEHDSERIEKIVAWIEKNKHLIGKTTSVKIILHIKGKDVAGEIQVFPDSRL